MNFSWALKQLNKGKKIKKEFWGENIFIFKDSGRYFQSYKDIDGSFSVRRKTFSGSGLNYTKYEVL